MTEKENKDEKLVDEFFAEFQNTVSAEYTNAKGEITTGSPIWYAGGKFYLLDWIYRLVPEHTCYVEVFGGSGQLLFFKKPSEIEIYNDIDELLVTLFRVIKTRPKELFDRLFFTPYSRSEFNRMLQIYRTREFDDDIDCAVAYFVINRMSFGGKMAGPTFGYSVVTGKTMAYRKKIEHIINYSKRLDTVIVENQDFEKLIERYDGENTFFYLDPPYYGIDDLYVFNFKMEDHKRLADILSNIRGKFLLSYNAEQGVLDLYPKPKFMWYKKDYVTNLNKAKGIQRKKRTELLVANYDIRKEMKFERGKTHSLDKFLTLTKSVT